MRILLADSHAEARAALEISLEGRPELDLIGAAAQAQELFALARQSSPDLVLVDSQLPGASLKELIAALHALEPRPIVLVMSARFEEGAMILEAGADAFVSKAEQPDWLLIKLQHYAVRFCKKEAPRREEEP